MIQKYIDIKSREDIEDFDVREKFNADVLPLAIALHKACEELGIPYLFAATLSSSMDVQAGDTQPHGTIYGMNGNVSPIRDSTLYTALLAISSKTVTELGYRVTDHLSKDPLASPGIISALEKNGILETTGQPQFGGNPLLH